MKTVSGPNRIPFTASPVTKTCGTKFASKDLFDRRDAGCFAQSDVNDHQIRAPMESGGRRIGDIAFHSADRVAETLERFRKQSADDCVVFYDQSA